MDSAIILAAGLGSRLSHYLPKPLAKLNSGETIMGRQLRCLAAQMEPFQITAVVGHKKEHIMEAHPELGFVYNEQFDCTNTSKSLLRGLQHTHGTTLWLNGDVVLDAPSVRRVKDAMDAADGPAICVAVAYKKVGDEEVTFLEETGRITAIAKNIQGGLGEAVGINAVNAAARATFMDALAACEDQDYFEKAIEKSLNQLQVIPVDVSDCLCVEVDFPEDLAEANHLLDVDSQKE